jgi:uncharacterized damage-inducible protein DinB
VGKSSRPAWGLRRILKSLLPRRPPTLTEAAWRDLALGHRYPKWMTETERIAEQLKLLCEGPSWLGPPMDVLLADVSQETASQRASHYAHTIWELVLHIESWLRVARVRLTASTTVEPEEDENWPTPGGSWQDATNGLRYEASALQEAILEFPPERLEHVAPAAEPQTFYVLLHGVIQHSAYHAGQIAVLKKVIA